MLKLPNIKRDRAVWGVGSAAQGGMTPNFCPFLANIHNDGQGKQGSSVLFGEYFCSIKTSQP